MSAIHRWQLLAILIAIGLLLYLLGPVLTPFAVAALLAYLGDPLVDRLQTRGLSRSASVSIVFAAMTFALLLLPLILVPLLETQITTLVEKLPQYLGWIRERLMPLLVERLGVDPALLGTDQIVDMLKAHWQQAGGIATTVLKSVSQSGLAIIAWIMNLLLIPVVSFYFLRDWDQMILRVRELLPRNVEARVVELARQSDEVLSAFLRGQIAVMLALGLIYSIGLWMAGLKLAFLIGMGAGLLSFVPYLGGILGVGGAVIAALVEHHDVIHVVYVVIVFGVGQTLEGFVLTPWLVGDRIGLHPVAVIFAILAGGQLFGFIGVLLALPVTAVLMVILRHVHERYVHSDLYREGAKRGLGDDPSTSGMAGSAEGTIVGSSPDAGDRGAAPTVTRESQPVSDTPMSSPASSADIP